MTPVLRALFTAWLLPCGLASAPQAAEPPLKFGVGLFQPDRERHGATYRPQGRGAEHLS